MKVLVTGGGGQLASRLVATTPGSVTVFAPTRAELDISDRPSVDSFVERTGIEAIINAAAYTAVDRAETENDAAMAANALGPRNLALAAAARGAHLLHVSSDFVFDGSNSRPYLPEADTCPVSMYGRSKALGEVYVREALGNTALILRTSWVYSATGRSFLGTMLRLMRERGAVAVVADQTGSPTSVESLSLALWKAVLTPGFAGTHHFSDAGVASWYDFAVAIAEEAIAASLLTRRPTVTPIRTDEYPTAARRPAYSVLDKSSTVQLLGIELLHWRCALRDEIRRAADA